MDTGSKSLAQLSEEGKEKKFITIEVGSKVSGYTKDYLERLCRLNKVEYRLRDTGDFAIELESLLNETHTILLSYEGVTFIEKSELTLPQKPEAGKILSSALKEINTVSVASMPDDVKSDVEKTEEHFAQPVPRFGDMNHLSQQVFGGNPFSFVGRTVVSDGKSPEVSSEKETHIPIGGGVVSAVAQEIPIAQQESKINVAIQSGDASLASSAIPHAFPLAEKAEESIPPTVSSHTPLHVPISVSHDNVKPSTVASVETPHVPMSVPHKPSESIKLAVTRAVTPEQAPIDDWDALLFSSEHSVPASQPTKELPVEVAKVSEPVTVPEKSPDPIAPAPTIPEEQTTPIPAPVASGFDIASPYRPIKTSVDATLHHEGGDLFPEISKVSFHAVDVPREQKNEAPSSFVPQGGQKVIVFDPQALIHASESAASKDVPAAPKMIIPRAMPIDPGAQHVPEPVAPIAQSARVTPASIVVVGDPIEKNIIQKVPLSAMRVMPQSPAISVSALPELPEEHRVLIREDHPLLASRGLNIAFGLFIGATSLLLLGGVASGNLDFKLNSASYVAGVGNSNLPTRSTDIPVRHTPSPQELPFSNEVIVSSSTSSNTVQVTPVFTDGEGATYQYDMVNQRDVSASGTPHAAQ